MAVTGEGSWPDDPYWSQGFWDWRPPWIHPSKQATVRWAASRTVEPTAEPVSLEEARLHLRVDTPDDDSLILNLIATAREFAESQFGLALMTQTWKMGLDQWPRRDRLELWPYPGLPAGSILLPRHPVQSVTSVIWYGADGSTNTVDPTTYVTDLISRPARVALGFGKFWPAQQLTTVIGVQTTFVAGFTAAELVPRHLKQAILLLVGHWYENREEISTANRRVLEYPLAARDLLSRDLPQLVG